MRPTKTTLLSWANDEFPTYYRTLLAFRARNEDFLHTCAGLRRMFPHERLRPINRFPPVVALRLCSVRREELYPSADIELCARLSNGRTKIQPGLVVLNPHQSESLFLDGTPFWRSFCEHFSFHLVFNILDEEEIPLDDWNDLPE